MKNQDSIKVTKSLLSSDVILSDRCCGEAGTLAVSRPDISTQLRSRKLEELKKNHAELGSEAQKTKIMTSCPACQQGLSRYQDDMQMDVDYIVVELCQELFGKDWQNMCIDKVNRGGIERVLL